uniref:Uncharacterized protein n=1 Tax=Oryza barthii TaxID=65489 RepID=A0A0D3FYF8_9ORYZ
MPLLGSWQRHGGFLCAWPVPFVAMVKMVTEDEAEVFWSQRRWPKRRRRILGKETAGLGGGGIVRSEVWQKRLGVRAKDFSGGGGGCPRGSDRTEMVAA